MLIVRGRYFDYHRNYFRTNRALENLLWNWPMIRRTYVVYREGELAINCCDIVSGWLTHKYNYKDFCQYHLLDARSRGWCRPGALYSNIVCRKFQLFERRCDCSRDDESRFPWNHHNRNAKNLEVAIGLSRIAIRVLTDITPSVSPRDEPMISVLTSRE